MSLTKRCSECGATYRRHRRSIRGKKRLARWRGHFHAGMGRVAREARGRRRPDPKPEIAAE